MYRITSCLLQNINGLDCGCVALNALHECLTYDIVRFELSSAITPTKGFVLFSLLYLFNGCFLITSQHLALTSKGASIKYFHFLDSLLLGLYSPLGLIPVSLKFLSDSDFVCLISLTHSAICLLGKG